MEGLSYVGPSTWNELPNNRKTTISVNCFKNDIKEFFFSKLSETKAHIYT